MVDPKVFYSESVREEVLAHLVDYVRYMQYNNVPTDDPIRVKVTALINRIKGEY